MLTFNLLSAFVLVVAVRAIPQQGACTLTAFRSSGTQILQRTPPSSIYSTKYQTRIELLVQFVRICICRMLGDPIDKNFSPTSGDSYTQTFFDPKGVLPTPDNPLGNPPYPGWTSTGGENWVGYLATKFNKSSILTYNYAYGGAVINETLVTPWQPNLIHLTGQVDQFLEGAAVRSGGEKWNGDNALFSIFIGINDIGNSWYLEGDRDA